MLHIFINIVHFLIFADINPDSRRQIYLFIITFMCIFKSELAANEFYETSK